MDKKKILLLEGIHSGAEKTLSREGFVVETERKSLSGDALVQRVSGFHGLGIRSKTKLTPEVIKSLHSLEVIGTYCIGTDQVALNDANKLGVPVFNAPYSNTRSVAELVVCEMIALSRKLTDRSNQMHKGRWRKSAQGSNEIRGKTLGIVGYGHIGTQVSILAEALGLKVLFFDIVKKLPLGNAKSCESIEDLFHRSDFVTLHVPDTSLTRGMIGVGEINTMKRGSYLINASRGSVIEISALASAIKSGQIAGAAIDVFPSEPESNEQQFNSDIQELENVILTPHIGGSTEEAQEAIGQEVSESLIRYFRRGATTGAVNFPKVDVGEIQKNPRLLNIHKNVPGVLGAINGIISDLHVNIVAQNLATDPFTGYLTMDIDVSKPNAKQDLDEAAKRITALETSVRTRVLAT